MSARGEQFSARRAPGAWALILASVLWGTTGTAASFFPHDVSPLAVGACTMGIGGILLFLFSARGALGAIRDASSRRWLLIGALGVFAYPLSFYSAMNLAGVAVGNVVALGTGPVFAAILEWMLERRPLSKFWAACTVLAVVGVALLAATGGRGEDAAGSTRAALGVALGLVAGFSYALYTYSSSRAIRAGHGSSAVMGGMFGLGSIGLIPVLILFGAPLLQSSGTVSLAAYLAVGPMFVAYLLFGIGMRSLSSSTATTITLLEPAVATVLAVVVVGEHLQPLGWVGLAAILVAVALLSTARQTAAESGSP
jgi:DME family drug/metabolite transporter